MRKLAIFDYHGTLAWALDIHERAYQKTVKELYNVEGSIHDVYFAASTIQTVVMGIAAFRKVPQQLIAETSGKILPTYERYFTEELAVGHPRLLPGMPDLLKQLQQKDFILGLYTGDSVQTVTAILERVGLRSFFDFDLTSCASREPPLGNRKALILETIAKAQTKYGPIDNRSIYLFDDSSTGINAGKNIGIVTVGVGTGPEGFDTIAKLQPTFVYRTFEDYNQVIANIEA